MNQTQSSIDTSIFSFSYESKRVASRCNYVIESIFSSQIVPELELVVADKIPQGTNIELSTLEIDIGSINEKELKTMLAQRIKESFANALDDTLSIQQGTSMGIAPILHSDPKNYVLAAMELFLRKGYFPSWMDAGTSLDQLLLDLMDRSGHELIRVLRQYSTNDSVMKRLSFGVGTKVFEKLIYAINPVNSKWIINFRNILLTTAKESEFSKFGLKVSQEMIHFFIITYMLNESANSLNKRRFSDSILSSYIAKFEVQPKSLEGSFRKMNDKSETITLILTALNQIQNKRPEASVSIDTAKFELQRFISDINTKEYGSQLGPITFTGQQIIGFIRDKKTRNLLSNELNDTGIRQILELFYRHDAKQLISFIASFKDTVGKIKDGGRKTDLSLSIKELVLITILYLEKKSVRKFDFEGYFLFLASLAGMKDYSLRDSPPVKHFIETQASLSKVKLFRMWEAKQVFKETEAIEKALSASPETFVELKDGLPSVTTTADKSIDIYKRKIIEFYLNFGRLPKGFVDLNQSDVQRLFEDLIHLKDPFLANILRAGLHQHALYEKIEILISRDNSEALSHYLGYYFKDSYQQLLDIIILKKKQLNLSSYPELNTHLFNIGIILKSLIASKGEHSPPLFSFYVTRNFMDSLPLSFIHSNLGFEDVLSETADDLQTGLDISFNIRLAHEIERDYSRLIQQMRYWAGQTSPDQNLVGLMHRLRYYLKTHPEVLIEAVKLNAADLPYAVILFKQHLPQETWQLFKESIVTDVELKHQINKFLKESENLLDEMKDPAFDLLAELKGLRSIDSQKVKAILAIVLSDKAYFASYYAVAKHEKIPEEIVHGSSIIRSYLDALIGFVPRSFPQSISSDFWPKVVLRFAIQMKVDRSDFSPRAFSGAFFSHLHSELAAINEGESFYSLLNELRTSKTKILVDLLSVFDKGDSALTAPLETDVSEEKKLIKVSDDLKRFGNLSLKKQKQILSIIYTDDRVLGEFIRRSKEKGIPEELLPDSKIIRTYLTALVGFVPRSLPQSILSDFWRKVVVRFAVQMKMERSKFSDESFSAAFFSYLRKELRSVGEEKSFYSLLNELRTSKTKILAELLSVFDKGDSALTAPVEPDVSEENKITKVSDDIESFGSLSFKKQKQILSIIYTDDRVLGEFITRLGDKPIPTNILFGSRTNRGFVEALFSHIPRVLQVSSSKKYWKSIILRFAIQLKMEKRNDTQYVFARAFLDHLNKQLVSIDRSELLYGIIQEMEQSKNQILRKLSLLLHKIFHENAGTVQKGVDRDVVQDKVPYKKEDIRSTIHYDLAILAFYAHYGFFPWWSEKRSFARLIASIRKKGQLYGKTFETVFLEVESEEKFIEPLLARVPAEIIEVLNLIVAGHDRINTIWQKSVAKDIADKKQRDPIIEDPDREDKSKPATQDFTDPELLSRKVYFLEDQEILKAWLKEDSAISDQIGAYLKLSCYFYFRNITPGKWRQIVYNFAFEYYKKPSLKADEAFHRSFVAYLAKKHESIIWKDVFKVVYEKIRRSDTSTKIDFPKPLLPFIGKETEGQVVRDEMAKIEKRQIMEEEVGMEIKINNAGLILVWPFLTRFFEQLSWMANGKFLSDENRNRAVYMLQYLAYNETDYPEYELVLNKLLVGMPIQDHLSPITPLTKEEKDLAASLMNGLINNWGKVKNSSITGIQETFFQRSGMLRFNEENTTLAIDKRGVDVLLDSLSWNISLIKLSWMQKPIHVEWR